MRERHKARRYELVLRMTIEFSTGKKSSSWSGRTLDVSTRGVYFRLNSNLEVGMTLGLMIRLPTGSTDDRQVFIRATGKVVRIERRTEKGVESACAVAFIRRCEYICDEISDNSARKLLSLK
jgi:c-di-GMP-binding flagellar brake protein YcgR